MRKHVMQVTNLFVIYCLVICNTFAKDHVSLLSDRGDEITLSFNLPQYTIKTMHINGENCTYMAVSNAGLTSEKGFPALPYFTQSIIIPDRASMDLEILDIRYKIIEVNKVVPSKGIIYRNQNPADIPYVFDDMYTKDVWYPENAAEIGEPYILRDIRGIVATFHPFQYNPVQGKLRVAESMIVKIRKNGISTKNVLRSRSNRFSTTFDWIYHQRFINYPQYCSRYTPVPDGDKMIVITAANFKSTIVPLVDWKNKKGIKTELYEYPSETGGTGSSALQSFIQQKYTSDNITYILIVGDAEDVPSLNAGGGVSDPSYVLLAGADIYPDAFIGRFSSSNVTEIETMVNKVLKYEMEPDPNGEWYHKATGIASSDGSPADKEWMEGFRTTLLAYNYTEVDTIYDPGASASDVSEALNDGRSWVNYMGHGSKSYWGTSGYGNSNVTSLNNQNRLPVIISVACNNGEFDGGTCFGETWLLAGLPSAGKGAVIFLGASISQAWNPPQYAQQEMVKHLTEDTYISVGGIIYNGEMKMLEMGNDQNTFVTWILFGDPSLMHYTNKPTTLNVTHPNTVNCGTQNVIVSSENGVRVCLYSKGQGIQEAKFISGGSDTFAIEVTTDDTIYVTGTKFNRIPYKDIIVVEDITFIEVNSPNGGEQWERANPYEITWTHSITGNVKIELLKCSIVHSTVAADIANASPFSWTIPDTTTLGSDYKVKISSIASPTVFDTSDASFSIVPKPGITVIYPNGGDTVFTGSDLTITWSTVGVVGDVKIEFSTDNGAKWSDIIASTSNDGKFNWTVPNVSSDTCLIMISEASGHDPVDVSDNVFTIVTPADPPEITKEPSQKTVQEGKSTYFYITAKGTPTLEYQWQDSTLTTSKWKNVTSAVKDTFPIASAVYADSGNWYRCIVSNSAGADTSDSAQLIVTKGGVAPEITTELPENVVKVVGEAFLLTVKATGTPEPSYTWKFGTTLSSTFEVADTVNTLLKTSVKKDHGGYYFCIAENDKGKDISDTVHLSVVTITNSLTIAGSYTKGDDSATITLANINTLNQSVDSLVTVLCSRDSSLGDPFYTASFTFAQLSGLTEYPKKVFIDNAPFDTVTIYCGCYVTGKNGDASGRNKNSFVAGQLRPVYEGELRADTVSGISDRINLSWDADTADSIRILWSTDKEVPVGFTEGTGFSKKVVSASVTADSMNNLTPGQVYYVGLQVLKEGWYSAVTAKSRTNIKTPAPDSSLIVVNKFVITDLLFDSLTNSITVSWSIDTAGLAPTGAILQWGYSYSMDKDICKTTQPSSWIDLAGTTGSFSINLGTEIQFEKMYYTGLWLRANKSGSVGPAASPVEGNSVDSVTTPAFTWQEVTFFQTNVDTFYAANGNVLFVKDKDFTITDTVIQYAPAAALLTGMADVGGTGFRFSGIDQNIPSFTIGIRYAGLMPPNNIANNVGMYQEKNSTLHVMRGFEVSNATVWMRITSSDMKYPFCVLADTTVPSVIFETDSSDTAGILQVGQSVPCEFTISDNTANVNWSFMYGLGNAGYDSISSGELAAYRDTIGRRINVPATANAYGVRARIIIDDGMYSDTVDVSRRVATATSDIIDVGAVAWVPLRATSHLDDSSLSVVLSNLSTSSPWEYDPTKFRAVQWYDPTGGTDCRIVEYSEANKDLFALIPGRIVWLKSADAHVLTLGSGVTSGLKGVYTIELKSGMWTDFTTPYKFQIGLKDILTHTAGSDSSLVFYHWDKSGSTYVASPLYIPELDSLGTVLDTAAIKCSSLHDAYTVYNRGSGMITLNIPPIPKSNFNKKGRPAEAGKTSPVGEITFLWNEQENSYINRIRCGWDSRNPSTPIIGPLPPFFNKLYAGVTDSKNKVGGYALYPLKEGEGLSYEIALFNASSQVKTIEYRLGNLENLPEGYTASIYTPETGQYENVEAGKGRVTLQAGSNTRRWVVAGSDGYLDSFLGKNYIANFALVGAYPNPFRRRIHISYVVPWYGVRRITFRIFDLQGRTIWMKDIAKGIECGMHTVTWNMSSDENNYVASGVYLFQMTVYENGKKGKKVFKRKLMCLR